MARQELQVELKKLESDYEQKLQDLSQEKEQLSSSKQEREKEIQGLQQQLSTLKQQVHTHTAQSLHSLSMIASCHCQYKRTKTLGKNEYQLSHITESLVFNETLRHKSESSVKDARSKIF